MITKFGGRDAFGTSAARTHVARASSCTMTTRNAVHFMSVLRHRKTLPGPRCKRTGRQTLGEGDDYTSYRGGSGRVGDAPFRFRRRGATQPLAAYPRQRGGVPDY